MSIIKYLIILIFFTILHNQSIAEEVKKIGKFKDWETMVIKNNSELVCFAQSKPVLQSPKKNSREARLFVTFRPNQKISDEISITAGYEFNKKNSITARSGKKNINLIFLKKALLGWRTIKRKRKWSRL